MINADVLSMWKGKSINGLLHSSIIFKSSLYFFNFKIFREAVIRLLAYLPARGKSGHHRVGFPVKTGGACVKVSSRPVPQKINRSFRGVRVKRWGKSPPPLERLSGHGKPNPMQDEIGNRATRLWFRVRRTPHLWGFDHTVR